MIVTVAFAVVVMVVSVLMLMVVTVAFLTVLMAVAFLTVMVVMVVVLVVMVVTVALHMLVQLVVESGVVDGMEHPVPELVLVDIDDGAHEREAYLLHGLESPVVLHAVLQVGEVERDALPVLVDYRRLDVTEEATRLLGDPLSDGQEGLRHPGLGIGVPSRDGPLEALGASPGLLEGGMLVLMVVIVTVAFLTVMVVVMVVFLAHLIIS